jgi:hypothetical protein
MHFACHAGRLAGLATDQLDPRYGDLACLIVMVASVVSLLFWQPARYPHTTEDGKGRHIVCRSAGSPLGRITIRTTDGNVDRKIKGQKNDRRVGRA